MKHKISYILRLSLVIFGITILNSCHDDSPEEYEPGSSNVSQVTNILEQVITDWNSSPSEVGKKMSKFTKSFETDEFIKYTSPDNTYFISYDFKDGKLRSSLLLIPYNSEKIKQQDFNFKNYEYLGENDGAKVYANDKDNTFIFSLTRNLDGEDYLAFGFSPIKSDLFEEVEPIEVTTKPAEAVSTQSLTLNGSFSGIDKVTTARFYYSYNADMSDLDYYNATITGDTFTRTLTNLKPNTTVYFYAAIIIENVEYRGEVLSADLVTVKTYSIGDLYPDALNPIGVVCQISNNGVNGKIISLEESFLQWSTTGIFNTDEKAYDHNDGTKNNLGNGPYGKWVTSLGNGWYGPAKNELTFSSATISTINQTLLSIGKSKLYGFYWSSTQKDSNNCYVVTVGENGYLGYSNQYTFYHTKDQKNSVIAMKRF